MSSPKRYPLAFYVVTPLLASLVPLLLIELALALFWPVPFAAESNMYYEADPHTSFRLKPNSSGSFGAITARVNSRGHRDDEVSLEKPPGVFRVLALGDSFTMGAGVAREEIYVEVLERWLGERIAAPVEVINTGVGGWHPHDYAQYYEYNGAAFDPDVVLVGFFVGNDAFSVADGSQQLVTVVMGRRIVKKTAEEDPGLVRVKLLLYSKSHLARSIMNKSRLVLRQPERKAEATESRDGGKFNARHLQVQTRRVRVHRKMGARTRGQLANAVRQIARIRDLTAAKSVPLFVVLIPDENQINRSLFEQVVEEERRDKYDLAMPQKLLVEMFAEEGIETIDLLPDFLADERRLYQNDTHWTAEGHLLAARRIFEVVEPLAAAKLRNRR